MVRLSTYSPRRLGGLLIAAVIAGLLGVWGYQVAKKSNITSECASDARILARNSHGDVVRMVSEVCGGFAYSSATQLEVQRYNASRSSEFFSYEGGSSKPLVAWTAPDTITVELFEAGDIHTKLDKIDGINLRYEIGIDHWDASWLSQLCLSSESAAIGVCTEYVAAVLIAQPERAGFENRVCLPHRMPLSDGVAATQQWLRRHPNEPKMAAHTAVREALASAFPCKL